MKNTFRNWFILGCCLTLLWGCMQELDSVDSFESADQALQDQILPKIELQKNLISDQIALNYAIDNIEDPLPSLDNFPLYAAKPTQDSNIIYLEIFSSSEKANATKENQRWLVEVAQAFNQKQVKTNSGKLIQVGVRKIASGTAARLLASKTVQPAAYSPSNDLWISMLQSQGLQPKILVPRLVPNVAGLVLQDNIYQELAANGEVTFETIIDAIAAGKLSIGYPNPYSSSTALNLLYTLFWRAAGHQSDGNPLTIPEIQSPQVNSLFQDFQQQVIITTTTTLDLQEIFIRDPDKLQAFPLEYQNYQQIKQLSGLNNSKFIPFGLPHNNPLVGFPWNNPEQREGLEKFAEFAMSSEMQSLAKKRGFAALDYLNQPNLPPIPSGEVLTTAQSFWKRQKDAGNTVYLMTVIDTSGSMDGEPLEAVKQGLRIASAEINEGNYVGLITYADQPVELVPLAPFDELQHKRFLAAIDRLRADGSTAMYDGVMVALAQLMEQKKANPNGRFYLLLLTDGKANRGVEFSKIQQILQYSGVRIYPIAYGDVDKKELEAIAALRESTVKTGNPENVQDLLKGLFQTNL